MPTDDESLITITDPAADRYASLRLIDWWRQERVRNAHVMVIGAGALGNEVLKNLALLGVGYICIVDCDRIEASNLTRSVLFRREDAGQSKAQVAARRVRALNPDLHVIAINADVTQEVGLGVYRRMDLVLACLDNRAARMAVNTACWNAQRPWIDGALGVLDGQVQVFSPPESACYQCTMTEQDYALLHLRYSCPPGTALLLGQEPTMPTTASLIASIQVQEALKILHDQPVRAGQTICYSGSTLRLQSIAHTRRPDCPAHHVYASVVCLPCGVEELTLGRLLELARTHMQGEGTLYLPQPVVTSFYCAVCDREEAVYRPYRRVVPGHVPCPRCHEPRTFDMAGAFASTGLPADLAIPLAQLGVPALHVLPVHSRTGWYYFELSADEQTLLNWTDEEKR